MRKVYLAVPYTGMTESAYEQVNRVFAYILNSKSYNVFSPITHCHSIAKTYKIPTEWEFWKDIDFEFIDWADEVWVLEPLEGIEKINQSVGVQAEIDYAKVQGKEVSRIKFVDNKIEFYKL